MMRNCFACVGVLAVVLSLSAGHGRADEITFEGQAALMSDYVFRGISRTPGNPAAQLTLDLVHGNGLYAGAFFSNFNDAAGHDAETDFYFGYARSHGAYYINAVVSYNAFHGGGDSFGYFQFLGSVGRDFGLAYLSTGVAFTPDNREFGTGRSVYWYSNAEFPLPFPDLPPMSVDLKVGYEDFAGGFNKWDWSIGYYVDMWELEWGLVYHDTNLNGVPGSSSNILFSLRKYF